ncbi:MAG: hypothetical protein EBS68_16515 [Rhodobacteraceae bacterium]|nr:hypothetical protein [Paracoccaceae bacterium]
MKVDAVKMAKEFYEARNPTMKWASLVWWEKLHMAVLAEREACAEVCEKLPETFRIAAKEFGYEAKPPTAENYAAAIRTRGER